MSTQKNACPSCGQDYEKKENRIFCPHCRKLLPLTDISVSSTGTALQYIVSLSGAQVLKQSRMVLSMLPDILTYRQDDILLLRAVYDTAERELGVFIDSAAKKKKVQDSLKKLVRALDQAFFGHQHIERALMLFLEAFSLDADSALGGAGHPFIGNLSHSLDRDRFVRCLEQLGTQSGTDLWKDPNIPAASLIDRDSALKDESLLLRRAGSVAADELYKLMDTVTGSSYKDNDEKMPVAQLQSKLKDAFMDLPDIDFLVSSLLESAGLEYTQTLYHPPVSPAPAPAPARPRGTASGGTGSGGATGNAGSSTAGGSISGGITSGRGASGSSSGRNPSAPAVNGKAAANQTVKKKKRSLPKLILTALALYFAFLYIVKPVIDHFTTEANKKAAIEAQNSEEDSESPEDAGSTGTEGSGSDSNADSDGTETGTATVTDPYPAPSVSTSSAQSGLYAIGNIASPSQYAEYQGPESSFRFRYPRVLYDSCDYTYENDGQDIDIVFSCRSDPSSLTVYRHPLDVSAQEYRDTQMASMESSLDNLEVLADRKSMAGALADTRSEESYTVYVKGTDKEDPEVVTYQLCRIGPGSVQGMTLKYPRASGSEDLALKEYYAQVMYELCGFGGNTEHTAWSEFKKDYE